MGRPNQVATLYTLRLKGNNVVALPLIIIAAITSVTKRKSFEAQLSSALFTLKK